MPEKLPVLDAAAIEKRLADLPSVPAPGSVNEASSTESPWEGRQRQFD